MRRVRPLAATLALVAAIGVARAGQPEAEHASPTSALREEVVRIDVTLTDLAGRRETRPMPVTIFRSDDDGKHPLAVFNHGRGGPAQREAFGRFSPKAIARYFVDRGFVVLVPTRIGYGETFGDFDPEENGRCDDLHPEVTARAAADQVLATVAFARTLGYVDATRWIVAGQSVGGFAAVATLARRPDGLVAGINFAGGTGFRTFAAPGRSCGVDRVEALFRRFGAESTAPMVWMYWINDRSWGDAVPRTWYAAWSAAGGRGTFHQFPPQGDDGHAGIGIDMAHWVPVVDDFLAGLDLRAPSSQKVRGS